MNGLFFTGTDTGVGKTFVVAEVARCLRRQGRSIQVTKPVATGASEVNSHLLSEDTLVLARAAGHSEMERITPWVYAEPVAPAVAARIHGERLDLEWIYRSIAKLYRPGEVVLVEGIGGLLCPLTERETVADLAVRLELGLIVVARRSLGTLNHTLLTVEAALSRRLPVVGVVVSETTQPDGLAEQTNVDELRRRLPVPILAVIPHQEQDRGEIIPAMDAVDWWKLSTRLETRA